MSPPGTYTASTDGPVVGVYAAGNGNGNGTHKAKALKTAPASTPSGVLARSHGVEAEKGALPEALESWRANLRGDDTLTMPRPANWWTGKVPQACAGFIESEGALTSLPLPNILRTSREETLAYFDNTWTLTEVLFSALQGEEPFYRPPYHNLRHPLIFYYAHPAALYVNKLRVAGVLSAPINEYFETIFETGVDEMSWDDLSKNEMEWPSVAAVTAYRRQVYSTIRDVILTHPCLEPASRAQLQSGPAWAVFMAFEHERIHIETSTVLFRELPARLVAAPPQWPPYHPTAAPAARDESTPPAAGVDYPLNALVAVPAGQAVVGKPADAPTFGWDNEYGRRAFHVRAFEANKFLCSNGEFLEFVRDGGYATQAHWSPEGWKWRSFRNAKWPPFWVPCGPAGLHQYRLRLAFDVVPMAWSLPVDVNRHEGIAYCNWQAARLGEPRGALRMLSEIEHHRLRDAAGLAPDGAGAAAADAVARGSGMQLRGEANLNLAYSSSSAVDALPPTSQGFYDVQGNVWEWCEDHFSALPGFRLHPYYDDFSTPCFDGEHSLIMGGSWASTGDVGSAFARFHFRPHFHQHAGFRVVRAGHLVTSCMDAPPPHAAGWVPPSSDPAKRAAAAAAGGGGSAADAVAQQLLLHYGAPSEVLGPAAAGPLGAALAAALGYPQRCAELLLGAVAAAPAGQPRRALALGCAVGGCAFALAAAGFAEVLGVEHSLPLVRAAEAVRAHGRLDYSRAEEGGAATPLVATRPAAARAAAVSFRQMDAACLAPDLGAFDAVLIEVGILDRLTSPKSCLGRMGGARGLVRPGGALLVVCSYDWSEARTPAEGWLCAGGLPGALGVAAALGREFELQAESELPVVLREGPRRLALHASHATLWRRVGGPAAAQ